MLEDGFVRLSGKYHHLILNAQVIAQPYNNKMQLLIWICLSQLVYLTAQTFCNTPINSNSYHKISSIQFLNQTTDTGTSQNQIYLYDGTKMQKWGLNSDYSTTFGSQFNIVDNNLQTFDSLLYTFPNGTYYLIANSTTTKMKYYNGINSTNLWTISVGFNMSFIYFLNASQTGILVSNGLNYLIVRYDPATGFPLSTDLSSLTTNVLLLSADGYKSSILYYNNGTLDIFYYQNKTKTYHSKLSSKNIAVSPDWTSMAIYGSQFTISIYTYNSAIDLYNFTQTINTSLDIIQWQDSNSFMGITTQQFWYYVGSASTASASFQNIQNSTNPNAGTTFTALTNITGGFAAGTDNGMFVTIQSCPAASFYVNNSCLNCGTNCIACVNNTSCTLCNINSYLDSNGNCCSNSNANCASCPNSTICQTCASNYYLDYYATTCLLTSNLQYCQTSNATGCGICNNGYFVSTSGYCASTSNCLNATSSGVCSVCVNNYYLNGSDCMANSQLSTCTAFNKTGCTACNSYSNYSTTTQGCSITNNCVISDYTTGICYNCASSYFVSTTGFCCLPYCIMCPLNDSTVCTGCVINAYMNNSVCVKCPMFIGCTNCLNSTVCQSCNTTANFVLNRTTML